MAYVREDWATGEKEEVTNRQIAAEFLNDIYYFDEDDVGEFAEGVARHNPFLQQKLMAVLKHTFDRLAEMPEQPLNEGVRELARACSDAMSGHKEAWNSILGRDVGPSPEERVRELESEVKSLKGEIARLWGQLTQD